MTNPLADLPLIELRNITRSFSRPVGVVRRLAERLGLVRPGPVIRAVSGVNLTIRRGEVLGLVGESGCGKSTLGRIVAGINQPSSGEVLYRGQVLAGLRGDAWRHAKRRLQLIFQDPSSSLNGRMPVAEIVGEAARYHRLDNGEPERYVAEQLRRAGLDPSFGERYPHQLSGGQRQRVGIARALAVQPELIVCDESVAALDVSIQAQIINLFMDLSRELGLTYLFISHDLGTVRHISDRVAIMYLGRIVEEAPTERIFAAANHPYTRALIEQMPKVQTEKAVYQTISGELPSPVAPPAGCHFHPRCPRAMPRCAIDAPALRQIAPDHLSACHLNA